MKIGIAQIDCEPCNVDRNIQKIRDYSERAKQQECDLVIFPEMSDTGYDPQTVRSCASSWSGGPCDELSSIAAELELHLVCGLSELVGDDLFNAVAVFGPDGKPVTSYRKSHLMADEPICEHRLFAPGNSLTLFNVGDLKFGLMICYDLRFPEMARALTLRGAEVILLSSAWPLSRLQHWKALVNCRAIENQLYMVCANRVGSDGRMNFCGASCLIDPWGESVAPLLELEEDLIVGTITKEVIQKTRDFMHVFNHRRADLY